ncbi:hypothetical protein ARZXY2_2495 [Arthrobacter sp. ZXY-2]|nr:hypothetical protein ARZXY2_2495 [Arthrobacter sp. ZXY-2]
MNNCKRSCCWTPYSCAKKRACSCHWRERQQEAVEERVALIQAEANRAQPINRRNPGQPW